ncbi:MAG: hypothetical protein KGL39_40565 [Patescibacteria group bacterium]|nr:hypothetical protein [Patescibacteria group bacterium]
MAAIPGYQGEKGFLNTYDYSGTITTGGTAQLILPRVMSRSYLFIQNISDTDMYLGIGPATAIPTVTSGAVASIAVANAGFGYTYPPLVRILGGGAWNPNVAQALSAGLGSSEVVNAATNRAVAHATLTANAVSAITMDNVGSGYTAAPGAPYVYLENDPRDPFGCYLPSATAGILLPKAGAGQFGNPFMMQNSIVCTDPVSIFCASSSKAFTCKVME